MTFSREIYTDAEAACFRSLRMPVALGGEFTPLVKTRNQKPETRNEELLASAFWFLPLPSAFRFLVSGFWFLVSSF
jgi:hypothetical protein